MSAFLEIPIIAPRSIILDPPLSDEEFERLAERCDVGSIERTREGAILVNAPAGGATSSGNNEIGRHWETGGSSTGAGGSSTPAAVSFYPTAQSSIQMRPTLPLHK
jgi:hypothetical protein